MNKLILLSLLLSALIPAQAETALKKEEVQQIENKVEQARQKIQSLQMDFKQTLTMKDLPKPAVSTGVLYYNKPGCLRMNFTAPAGDTVLINQEVYVVAKKGAKPKVRSLKGADASSRPPFLVDAFEMPPSKWRERFNVAMTKTATEIVVTLTPKGDADRMPPKILVTLSSQTWLMRSIFIEIPGGSMTYSFTKIDLNAPMKKNLFSWNEKAESLKW